jgi:uncharacterized protein (TIGR00255 family)
MSVYSMTGYASVQRALAGAPSEKPDSRASTPLQITLELRSVNSRFLDLSLKLPDEFRQHESTLRDALTPRIRRGKVELRLSLDGRGPAMPAAPTGALLARLAQLQGVVHASLPQAAGLSVAEVLRLSGSDAGTTVDAPQLAQALLDCTTEAATALASARAREGERLAAMLLDRCAQLRALAQQAAPLVPELVAQQKQRFLERWREALSLAEGSTLPEAAQERALTEATAFAIRIDVAEELTRLHSHLEEIERLCQRGGEIGKRLDFLIQELHREANTLGSKAAALSLTRIAVDMKVLIEQMREQVQNIE